ncbi:MAG TPA: UbiD family decarboxylase [Pirellulales bacterium]|nr:UbiD family decarboxylase [Pirellulales bacterium]
MGYRTLRAALEDLSSTGQLAALDEPVDARLEAAEIQRRVQQAGGPAILFNRVLGCAFPLVSNLFGTLERARFLFRDTWEGVRRLIELKADPAAFWRCPRRYLGAPRTALHMRPKWVRRGPVLAHATTIDQLPRQVSWPRDGGPFITLPCVYTEDPARPGWRDSNLGMYRVQLAGGKYRPNEQVGLHYQIHRGIGVHHARALEQGAPLRVNISVGGAPAMTLAAVMPLPEGLPELMFAGALAGQRIPLCSPRRGERNYGTIYAEADFCLSGIIEPNLLLPEGPFGDHLGYYSLQHHFPVLRVERVFHRSGAIWPFTVVGRPPQEDTIFGQLIHELTGPLIPTVLPGVKAVHAVDAAGVHPLLLAIGTERYTPYAATARPQEILTQASAILGQGQMSLAKYLWIANAQDDAQLDVQDVGQFFTHMLQRVDWRRDLHFQTCTTIDTLDYSGSGFNEGSKVVIAAAGPPIRELGSDLPTDLSLPAEFGPAAVALPGVLVLQGPKYAAAGAADARNVLDPSIGILSGCFAGQDAARSFPLIVLVDDAAFTARTLANFLWVTFTRSNPAADMHGVDSFVAEKHWGCRGPLIIDARIKPQHAAPLEVDRETAARADRFFQRGAPLARWG